MLTFLSLWGKNPTWFHNLHLHAFATLFWKCAGLIGSQVICALTQLKAYYSRGAVIRGGRGLFVLSYFSGSFFFFFFQFIKSLFEAVTFFFFFAPFRWWLFVNFEGWQLQDTVGSSVLYTHLFCLRPSGTCLIRSRGIVSFSSQQMCSRLRLAALLCGADVDHYPFPMICEPFLRRGGRGFCGVGSPVWIHFNRFCALGGLLYLIKCPCIMFGSAIILSPPPS